MNIAICDDEKNAIEFIQKKIELQGNMDSITTYSSAGDMTLDEMRAFDLIFLDIEMPGIDGMEAVEILRAKQEDNAIAPFGSLPLIVFVTGYKEYMGWAFEVSAFDYLVKPVDDAVFEYVYKRARKFVESYNKEDHVVAIKSAGKTHMISISDILYVESANRKNLIHFKDGKKLEYYGTMNDLETELNDSFFRIHKGFIVNFTYVLKYDRTAVTVKGDEILMMSKYRYQDFLNAYMNYLRKRERLV